jgi:type IV secretion system protein VirB3
MTLRDARYLEDDDPLVAGLTRPAMYAGVTQSFFIINLWVCVMLFVGTGSFFWFLVAFPLVHAIGYLVCLKDPRFFDILIAKVQRVMKCKNGMLWGGNSYDPF